MDIAGVWALLLGAACAVVGLVWLAAVAERPGPPPPAPDRLLAQVEELAAYATEAQAKAERATEAAVAAGQRLAEVEQARDQAWQALEAAGTAYQDAWEAVLAGRAVASRYGAPPVDTDRDEILKEAGERRRTVSRAAVLAYRRGDISVHQLREVCRRVGASDSQLRERELLAYRRRLDEGQARRAYERAALRARQAAQAAQIADTAARAMIEEAVTAAAEAQAVLVAAQKYDRGPRQSPP